MAMSNEDSGVADAPSLASDELEAPSPSRCCPNAQCRFDKHEDDANFCVLCGTLLYALCEDCLATSPRYARFCHHCGQDLDELRREADKAPVSEE